MDSNGFTEFLKILSGHGERLDHMTVAMESTGCYQINLFSFLIGKGGRTVAVNPLLITNFAKLSLRKTKTNKKDAMIIARFPSAQKDSISRLFLSQDLFIFCGGYHSSSPYVKPDDTPLREKGTGT